MLKFALGVMCTGLIVLQPATTWAQQADEDAPADPAPAPEPTADAPPADEDDPPAAEQPADDQASPQGATVENLFADFLHFVKLGRFEMANSYGAALLKRQDLDPVELLNLSDKYRNSVRTLISIMDHVSVGENAKRIIDVIHEGERLRRKDPTRIKKNIEKLGGSPQMEFNAINHLRESGEYAIPWMLSALQNRDLNRIHPRITKALPRIERGGVGPLVIALQDMKDDVIRTTILDAMGQLGYPEQAPYVKAVMEGPDEADAVRQAAAAALAQIETANNRSFPGTAADLFFDLAESYYAEILKPANGDALANIWFWRENHLEAIQVPSVIFAEVMAMRSCERALQLNADMPGAVALWLASDLRREADLGLDVESEIPNPEPELDRTRPADFPRSIYFARAYGPQYSQMVLARALERNEAPVALGAVAALAATAGQTSLIGSEDLNQPLVQALTFSDLVVRVRAALALGNALPITQFSGSRNVIPVLSEALAQTGQRAVVVVDPDEEMRNQLQGMLREMGALVVSSGDLTAGLQRGREELPVVDAVFVATDIDGPNLVDGIAALRKDYLFQSVPVLLIVKSQQMLLAERIVSSDHGVGRIVVAGSTFPPQEDVANIWQEVAGAIGRTPVTEDSALALALQAAETLRLIAISGSTVYDFSRAEPALIAALSHPSEELRVKAASVLALALSDRAQQAIATLAMSTDQSEDLRIVVFASLAESAKKNGNRLGDDLTAQLIEQAVDQENLTLRTSASKALGAMNLPSGQANQILQLNRTTPQ
jgi:HEAT repeat protein